MCVGGGGGVGGAEGRQRGKGKGVRRALHGSMATAYHQVNQALVKASSLPEAAGTVARTAKNKIATVTRVVKMNRKETTNQAQCTTAVNEPNQNG